MDARRATRSSLIVVGLLVMMALSLFGSGDRTIYDTPGSASYSERTTHVNVVNRVTSSNHDSNSPKKRYVSSPWEQLWLQNIAAWEKDRTICEQIISVQRETRVKFLNHSCVAFTDTPWCKLDDSVSVYWWNHLTDETVKTTPSSVRTITPYTRTEWDSDIFSYFEITDPITGKVTYDYIEPLVSHLRQPCAACPGYGMYITSRFYVLPTQDPAASAKNVKRLYFDAGASSWSAGAGGPSLSYFTSIWRRFGIDFDHIYAYEATTPPNAFYNVVPSEWKDRVTYQRSFVSSSVLDDTYQSPFLPKEIERKAKPDDYVFFKLDIDNGPVEIGQIMYIMDSVTNAAPYVDELAWEHHVDNYLMAKYWTKTMDLSRTIGDSYEFFLYLRQHGIRAHSWV